MVYVLPFYPIFIYFSKRLHCEPPVSLLGQLKVFKGGEILSLFQQQVGKSYQKLKLGSFRRKPTTNRKPVCLGVTSCSLTEGQN